VAPLFEIEPLGPIEVKGKREAVPAYRVVGRKTEPGRTRGIEGLSSPLIGRENEFEKLKSVLEDFKNARGGSLTTRCPTKYAGSSRVDKNTILGWERFFPAYRPKGGVYSQKRPIESAPQFLKAPIHPHEQKAPE
jgi:hypothetical protein